MKLLFLDFVGMNNENKKVILKPDIMARHNVIYIMAWCARDNPLGYVVPGTPNRANGIWGRCFLTKGQL